MRISDTIHDSIELGEFIRLSRYNHGLTLSDLAQRADVALNTIQQAEKGGNLNLSTLLKILKALGAELTINGVMYPPTKRRQRK